MPASLYTDMNANSGGLEDHRAMQLALELTMLAGINADEDTNTNGLSTAAQTFEDSAPRKRSANMTECVPVPSSEHVAEIVGRQGCKIKALRAKTNTYIKTPVRGEEPVFVVTGRKEDVAAAKREILSAADHFSQIRASRRNNSASGVSGTSSNLTPGPPSPNTPGQVTIQVRVPYRVVGLVVGPKGATIKRIQQQTHTYIVTPSRDKEPVFEVTGLPENVEKARQEIESHIAMRTGGIIESHHAQDENDFHTNGVDSGFHELGTDIGSVYPKTASSTSAFSTYTSSGLNGSLLSRRSQEPTIFNFPPVTSTTSKLTDTYNPLTNGFNAFNSFNIYDNDEGISSPSFDPVPSPAGLWPELNDTTAPGRGTSLVSVFTSTGNNPTSTNTTSCSSVTNVPPLRRSSLGGNNTTPRLSPTLESASAMANGSGTGSLTATTLSGSSNSLDHHPMLRRIRSDPLTGSLAGVSTSFGPLPTCTNNYATTSTTVTTSSCPDSPPGGGSVGSRPRRNCLVCSESEVVAALVPCGHNLFCMECANLIVEKPAVERLCPVCQQIPTQMDTFADINYIAKKVINFHDFHERTNINYKDL